MSDFTIPQSSANGAADISSREPQTSNILSRLTGTHSSSIAQQVLLDLAPRNLFDGVYFLIMNACIPLFEPRVLRHWFFAFYTIVNVACNVAMVLYLQKWPSRVAAQPARAAQWFTFFKSVQNFGVASVTGWSFLEYGINPVTSLATMSLIAFAVGTIVSLRPSVMISRIALLCCLVPATAVGAWLGGRAGYGTAGLLLSDILFLWSYGRKENNEYWRAFRQARELMLSRRKATQEGARIGDALLTNAARHSAIVAERNRIAYEWHDTLLAGFSAISWQLDEAKRRQREDPQTAPEALELAGNMLQHYRAEARLVIADLLYEETESLDLTEFLRRSADGLIGRSGIRFTIGTDGNVVPLSPEVVRQLSRICQEAISNAVRHGHPRQIDLRINFDPKDLRVTVSDDGRGFNPLQVAPGHFGLHIIKQRTRRLGGEINVESVLGKGTTIQIAVPYSTDFNMTPTRILVIEDQYFSRLALHTVIDRHSDMHIVGEADTAQAGLTLFQTHAPDVVIVDLKLPDQSGIEVIKAIRKMDPLARIVVLSNFEGSEYLYRATDAGAMAYLTKDASADELSMAIRAVRVGQSFIPPSLLHLLENRVAGNDLTMREQGVLRLLVLGWSNKQIGDHLGIAEKTVRIHLSNIFAKLGAANRTQAVLIALQSGFVDTPLDGKTETLVSDPPGSSSGEEG
jgi:DNA-binding NarL/FixJ family response regulator/signal transduction histidine kinase